jgi:hypothetical protein
VVASLPSGPSITGEAYLPRPEGPVSPPIPERVRPPYGESPSDARSRDQRSAEAAPPDRRSSGSGHLDRRDRRGYGRPRPGGGRSRPGGRR